MLVHQVGLQPAQDGAETYGEAATVAEPIQTPEQFCLGHQTPFNQYRRGDRLLLVPGKVGSGKP